MEEHYLRIIEDDVECLDCEEEPMENSIEESAEIRVKNKDKSNVKIKINEQDGVNIEVNDN